jgi:hypothetical protein
MSEDVNLDAHHRATVEKIFRHPAEGCRRTRQASLENSSGLGRLMANGRSSMI